MRRNESPSTLGTLDYGSSTPRPLWPAVLIALIFCTPLTVGATLLATTWGGAPLTPVNIVEAIACGVIAGFAGTIVTLIFAARSRPQALLVAVAGTAIVASLSGSVTFVLTYLGYAG